MLLKKSITKTFTETQKVGKNFAKEILKIKSNKFATVLCLYGNLGAGKTTFLQGFAEGLEINEKILSPTFVIMKRFGNFYHFDCYRLNSPEEILELGFEEIISNPKNIIAIEWPEKIEKFLPQKRININFKHLENDERMIEFIK